MDASMAAATSPDAAGAAATGGGPTTAPATDLSQAIHDLQIAVNNLQTVVNQFVAVSGGGAVGGALGGAANVGVAPLATAPAALAIPAADAGDAPASSAGDDAAKAAADAAAKATAWGDAKLTVKGVAVNQEQKDNIRAVLDKGHELGVSDKVLTAAVETIIVESTAHNYPGGDRDSVGLFQQRASWGSFDERHDPKTAAGKFYTRAVNYSTVHPDVATGNLAQKVQVSAFPDRYAQREAEANAAVSAYKASI
jgi:hypothetical protein